MKILSGLILFILCFSLVTAPTPYSRTNTQQTMVITPPISVNITNRGDGNGGGDLSQTDANAWFVKLTNFNTLGDARYIQIGGETDPISLHIIDLNNVSLFDYRVIANPPWGTSSDANKAGVFDYNVIANPPWLTVALADTNWQTSYPIFDANMALRYYKQTDANAVFTKITDINGIYAKTSDINSVFLRNGDVNMIYVRQSDGNVWYAKISDVNGNFAKTSDINSVFLRNGDVNMIYVRQTDGNTWYAKVTDVNGNFAKTSDINTVFLRNADVNFIYVRQTDGNAWYIKISDTNNTARQKAISISDWNTTSSLLYTTIANPPWGTSSDANKAGVFDYNVIANPPWITNAAADTNWQTSYPIFDSNMALRYIKQSDGNIWYAKTSDINSTYSKISDINETYAKISDINGTYQLRADMNVQYLSQLDANSTFLKLTGGKMTGDINMNRRSITGVRSIYADASGIPFPNQEFVIFNPQDEITLKSTKYLTFKNSDTNSIYTQFNSGNILTYGDLSVRNIYPSVANDALYDIGILSNGDEEAQRFRNLVLSNDVNAQGKIILGTALPNGVANGDINISGKYYGDGSALTGIIATLPADLNNWFWKQTDLNAAIQLPDFNKVWYSQLDANRVFAKISDINTTYAKISDVNTSFLRADVNAVYAKIVDINNTYLNKLTGGTVLKDLNVSKGTDFGGSIKSDSNRICFPANRCDAYMDWNGNAIVLTTG